MTWVITRVCRDCLDTSSIEVCPVDCIYECVGPASAQFPTRSARSWTSLGFTMVGSVPASMTVRRLRIEALPVDWPGWIPLTHRTESATPYGAALFNAASALAHVGEEEHGQAEADEATCATEAASEASACGGGEDPQGDPGDAEDGGQLVVGLEVLHVGLRRFGGTPWRGPRLAARGGPAAHLRREARRRVRSVRDEAPVTT
jgi:hypothetical protein